MAATTLRVEETDGALIIKSTRRISPFTVVVVAFVVIVLCRLLSRICSGLPLLSW